MSWYLISGFSVTKNKKVVSDQLSVVSCQQKPVGIIYSQFSEGTF
jgi:hypothetical protein